MSDSWKVAALTLESTGLISRRKIADIVGAKRSTCLDFLRSEVGKRVETSQQTQSTEGKTHLVIPDSQVRPGVSIEYLRWIGEYICKKRPEVVIHLGDFADLESLSTYDKGKKSAEGKRLQADLEAAHEGMRTLLAPLRELQAKQDAEGEKIYNPRLVITLGNHCNRLTRHIEANPELSGFLDLSALKYKEFGFEVVPFLTPISIDSVNYCHYYPNVMTGKPLGGSALTMLKTIGESFVMGHRQTLDVATRFLPTSGKQQWGIIAGACLEENHKILTSDLQYKPLGDLVVGDEVVSFEEESTNSRSRRYKKGTILAVRKTDRDVLKVTLASGKIFYATPDHRWFVKTGSAYRWAYTTDLRKGTCIPKIIPEWNENTSYNSGWLAGLYDGEGSLCDRSTRSGKVFQLSLSQKPGKVLDKAIKVLFDEFGEGATTHTNSRGVASLRIKGGVPSVLRVLGSIRPVRLLSKFTPDHMGCICCSDENNDKVISIEEAGVKTIVEVDIDKKTMIVEGYGHHNCYTHEEDYKGKQGNHHWRGIITLHNVKDGSFDPLFISLDWLERTYGEQ